MALKCNPQGQIKVRDIMDAVNKNEADIQNISSGSGDLAGDVAKNTSDIATIKNEQTVQDTKISALESDVLQIPINTDSINNLNSDVASNSSSIVTMVEELTNTTNLASLAVATSTDNTTRITTLEADVQQNTSDIAAINAGQGVYEVSVFADKKATGINGGSSVQDVWTPRDLNTELVNDISGAGIIANRAILPSGVYRAYVHAVVKGSAHQSRLYNETTSTVLGLGTTCPMSGTSFIIADFTLTAQSTIAVQTIVDTSIADTGFGAGTSFGDGVFLTMEIKKIGEI